MEVDEVVLEGAQQVRAGSGRARDSSRGRKSRSAGAGRIPAPHPRPPRAGDLAAQEEVDGFQYVAQICSSAAFSASPRAVRVEDQRPARSWEHRCGQATPRPGEGSNGQGVEGRVQLAHARPRELAHDDAVLEEHEVGPSFTRKDRPSGRPTVLDLHVLDAGVALDEASTWGAGRAAEAAPGRAELRTTRPGVRSISLACRRLCLGQITTS